MKYNLDLSCLLIQDYKKILKNQNLLPSRRVILQDIDDTFTLFENLGISDVAGLKKALSTPVKLQSFAANSGLSENYLTILKREIGSFEQKPVPIANFPDLDSLLISSLNDAGIKTSKDYFESGLNEWEELFCLCDLVRINGVGAVAAKVFYEAGYQSVSDVAHADAAAMLDEVSNINKAKQYYKANLGTKDMQFCIDFAKLLISY
ncbi:MAG: DUF4332 domain-containing protein [Oscillospiraceae bacterium]